MSEADGPAWNWEVESASLSIPTNLLECSVVAARLSLKEKASDGSTPSTPAILVYIFRRHLMRVRVLGSHLGGFIQVRVLM